METCRCGWNGTGDHLCHRCGKRPGARRFYVPSMKFSLAGNQLKFSAKETIGCDPCWAEFQQLLEKERPHGQT